MAIEENKHTYTVMLPKIFIVILFFTYLLPDNVFYYFPIAGFFVNMMSIIFPSVNNLGKQSEFSQIEQFVYSIGLLSIPFLSVKFYKNMKKSIRFKQNSNLKKNKPSYIWLIVPTFLFTSLAVELTLREYPGYGLEKLAYHSRIAFSFTATIPIWATSLFIAFLASIIRIRFEQIKK